MALKKSMRIGYSIMVPRIRTTASKNIVNVV